MKKEIEKIIDAETKELDEICKWLLKQSLLPVTNELSPFYWVSPMGYAKFIKAYMDEAIPKSNEPCLHDGKINQGHHADQPSWCDKCGEEL